MLPVLISSISSLVEGWFTRKKEEQKTKLAIEKNRQRLALSEKEFNAEWELESLKNSDKVIKRVSFILYSAPFVVALVFPGEVRNYFTCVLSVIPDWYVKAYLGITGSVWGIAALKTPITQIVKGILK